MLCIKIEELQTVLRFAAGSWSTPEFLVGIGLFLAMVVGIVQQQSRFRYRPANDTPSMRRQKQ